MQATELQSYNPLMILWSYDLVILLQSPRFQIFYLLRNSCCNPIIINDLMKFSSQKPHISREHGDIWYCCEVVSKRSIFFRDCICSWHMFLVNSVRNVRNLLKSFCSTIPAGSEKNQNVSKNGLLCYCTVEEVNSTKTEWLGQLWYNGQC